MVWLIALAFIICSAIVGFYQGAIRMAIAFLGLIAGAMLALPLAKYLNPVLAPFGLQHPAGQAFIAPVVVFLLFQVLFKTAAQLIHKKIDTHYKYKESDTKRMLWERLNERSGVCVGVLNGCTYFMLLSIALQVLGYFTIQVASSPNDPATLRFVNAFNSGLRTTKLDRAVHNFNPGSKLYHDASDIIGDLFHQPLLQSRLAAYPPFLTLSERQEFQDLANDVQLQEMLQKETRVGEILAHEKVKPLVNNKDLYTEIMAMINGDLSDLKTFLQTGKSPRFDSEKILGRWDLNVNRSLTETRRERPRMPTAELGRMKSILLLLQDATLTATIDNKVIIRFPVGEEIKRFEGSWRGPVGTSYTLTFDLGEYLPKQADKSPARSRPVVAPQNAPPALSPEMSRRYGNPSGAAPLAAAPPTPAEEAPKPDANDVLATVENDRLLFKSGPVVLVFDK